MDTKNNKITLGIILALCAVILIQWFMSSSKTAQIEQDYKSKLDALQEQTSMIMDKYEVQKTEQCRTAVMNVMTFKEEVEDMKKELAGKTEYKNWICDSLKNKPLDVVNPYDYYYVEKSGATGMYTVKEVAEDKDAQTPVTDNQAVEQSQIIPE